ncbi:MAG: MBL fold metallo-hydrolase [Candidatus Bathyarchaeia archaeon]
MRIADNIYLVECPWSRPGYFVSSCVIARKNIIIVDAGVEETPKIAIYPYIGNLGRKSSEISHLLLTHAHFDHCGGAAPLKEETKCRLGVHEFGEPFLREPNPLINQLSKRFPTLFSKGEAAFKPASADILFKDNDLIDIDGVRLRILHTPGHSVCSSCIIEEEEGVYICGDSAQGRGENRPLLFHSSVEYIESMHRLLKEPVKTLVIGHPFPPFGKAVLRGEEAKEHVRQSLRAIEDLNRLVLETLKSLAKPVSLRHLYEKIGVSQPVTVGCVLEDLEREGIVERVDVDLWALSV